MSETLRRYIRTAICIAAALCCGDRVWGQISLEDLTGQGADQATEDQPTLSPEEQIERIRELIPAIEQELAQTRAVFEAERAAEKTVESEVLGRSVEQLRQLLFVHEQLISEYQRLQQFRQASEGAREDLRAARAGRFEQLPPYDFATLDDLLSDRLGMRALLRRSEAELSRARNELARAAERLEELRSQRRSITEQSVSADDPAERTRRARRRELALIAERVGEATVELRTVQRDRASAQAEFARASLEATDLAIEYIEPLVSFTQEDLDQQHGEIERRLSALSETLESIREEESVLRTRLDAWTAEDVEAGGDLEQRIAIARETLGVLGSRTGVTFDRRGSLTNLRDGWSDRFRLAQGELSAGEIAGLVESVDSMLEGLDDSESDLVDRSRVVRSRLVAAQEELSTVASGATDLARQRIGAYRALGQDIDAALEGITQTRQLYLKLDDELGERGGLTLWDRVVIAWSYVTRIWSYEIIELDDDTALTVDKLVIGLLLLAVAFNLSRWLATLLSARVLPRFGLNTHAASAFKTIFFYVLLLTFALTALRIINVPLTIFAVLGGAVAIGIGFGSQTIASNFMSGLILLAERPVRVGDFIDVNGVVGTVQQIGARSTRIKTPTNIEMILPNSTLLDNNLVNWTLTDQVVWLAVEVGIAYGSPTREASKLILKAAEEHGRVLKTPPPRVIFDSFGDNSLNFRLFFSINMNQPSDRLSIPSDLRYRIDNLFRDADITIAFPQRDVHLDTLSPLQVELKRSRPASAMTSDDANEPTSGES
jgi:small-conductance mechanosensitive channel